MHGVVIFLRHHIEVGLQETGLRFSIPAVAGLRIRILPTDRVRHGNLSLLPNQQCIQRLLFMIGRVRNRTDFGKNIPHGCGDN